MSFADASPADRERVLSLVIRHGSNATAFQTLESGYRYFFYGSEACVAYVDTGGAWVAAGAPIAPEALIPEVAAAFVRGARAAGKRPCFFGLEGPLSLVTGETLTLLGIGEQPVWDPRDWPNILKKHRSLGEQLRRARAKGVRTRQLATAELVAGPTHDAVARVAERWLGGRGMAPMGFLVSVEPFSFPDYRRCFVAEIAGRVIGFAGVVPVPGRGGWFLDDLVRDPGAPNGTSELLVDAVMRWASDAECRWLTFGLAPLSGEVPRALALIRDRTAFLYDFKGLRKYKAKFQPATWSRIYLAHPPTHSTTTAIADALAAFAPRGLLRFAWDSLLRGPAVVLRALAILLVPWTLLLMLAPSERWFGTSWAKWGWIYFDIVLALGLFRLLRRPSQPLLTALWLLVAGDAALTTVEAGFWNLQHVQGALDYAVLFAACAGPALAAIVLWGTRRHRLRFL